MRLAGSYRILAFQKEKEETHFLESDFLKEAAKAVLRGVGLVGGGFFPPPAPRFPGGRFSVKRSHRMGLLLFGVCGWHLGLLSAASRGRPGARRLASGHKP